MHHTLKKPNLKALQTLNEKIQWYKLNFKHTLISQCAEKYEVRNYVKNSIGAEYLIPLLFHKDDYKEIKPENLPEPPFIIKVNHTSSTTCFSKGKTDLY
jgi:hypothetical protein